jgi:hypothetical protein
MRYFNKRCNARNRSVDPVSIPVAMGRIQMCDRRAIHITGPLDQEATITVTALFQRTLSFGGVCSLAFCVANSLSRLSLSFRLSGSLRSPKVNGLSPGSTFFRTGIKFSRSTLLTWLPKGLVKLHVTDSGRK